MGRGNDGIKGVAGFACALGEESTRIARRIELLEPALREDEDSRDLRRADQVIEVHGIK